MTRKRDAFTLVELLVVIAIISILAALTAAAVQKVRQRAQDVQCRADMSQLETALGNFKARFGVYPPSAGSGTGGTFRLQSTYTTAEPEWALLVQMFPRMNNGDNGLRRLQADLSPTVANPSTDVGAEGIPANNPVLLDPNQCLVFFLSGGVFTGYNGFASNPSLPFLGPFALTGSGPTAVSRLGNGAYYEFQQSRMLYRSDFNESYFMGDLNIPTPGNPTNLRFSADVGLSDNRSDAQYRREQPWYTDPWGSPYLYFGSLQNNDYPFTATAMQISPWGGTNSLNSATGVSPFFTGSGTAKKFFAPRQYQILSAGRDKRMGPGGAYAPGVGPYAINKYGGDDYSNFQQTPLGVTD